MAHGYVTGRPLAAREFSGGNATVAAALRRFGFMVRGSTSPAWTRDEVVLACDLVVANGWRELRTGDPRVTELSELLQQLSAAQLKSNVSVSASTAVLKTKATSPCVSTAFRRSERLTVTSVVPKVVPTAAAK